jgi:hypothetical protein
MKRKYSAKKFIDDSVLLDGLYEFHRGYFLELTAAERTSLEQYFLVGQAVPADAIRHRRRAMTRDPGLEAKALRAMNKVLALAGITP